ncbi:MAG: cytochrome c [Rhodospirillales bacterium]|nr:cytochrome c [Rhodospirillales bacterium]
MTSIRFFFLSGFVAALFVLAPVGPASADEEGEINYRKSVMKAISGHMGAMANIIKGKTVNKGDLKSHADAMAGLSNMAGNVFPKGSDFGETGTKAAVWQKPEEFKSAMTSFQSAADGMAKAVSGGDMKAIGGAFGNLGKSCKNCHDTFREKKKK